MTKLVVATSEGVPLRRDVAGAGSRLAAGLLDGMILLLGYGVVLILVLASLAFDASGISAFLAGLLIGGALLAVISYHVLFHALDHGRTPGKRALRIRVLSVDGRPPSLLQHVLRGLLWPIDTLLLVPVPIGLILVAAAARHQRLGDLVAGTILVRDPDERGRDELRSEPFPRETWSGLSARTLDLAPGAGVRLTGRDREFLRDLLSRGGLTAQRRRGLFVAAAEHYCLRLGLGRFADARQVLKEIYLFAREQAPAA